MKAWQSPDIPDLGSDAGVLGPLNLYDTSQSTVRAAGPDDAAAGPARMYVCGITPYDATHLGHAFTYLTFDLVNRVWRDLGFDVEYTQNVTDVDDPLLERAQQTGQDWTQLATSQIQLFRDDMEALRVIAPDHYIGAVEAIPSVSDLVQSLEASGSVYQVDDPDDPEHRDWYFSVDAASGFGSVSHLLPEAMRATFADMGGDPSRRGKRDPLDCLVWRMERPDEPSWESPLGQGRPGWHIECTAIALKHLGPDFHVQGGGRDLAFPHHEMCAAQGQVATGEPFARSFVHVGMVALDGEKMSKSKGNLELVSRLRTQGADPMAIRLALLSHHYRTDWEWTPGQLDNATERLQRWREALASGGQVDPQPVVDALRTALRDDLDTATALSTLDTWATEALAASAGPDADSARQAARRVAEAVDALLGIAL